MEERKFDIVDLYKKGYSIEFIINEYYRYKTKFDKPSKKIGNIVFINKSSITKAAAKKDVYDEIYSYIK